VYICKLSAIVGYMYIKIVSYIVTKHHLSIYLLISTFCHTHRFRIPPHIFYRVEDKFFRAVLIRSDASSSWSVENVALVRADMIPTFLTIM